MTAIDFRPGEQIRAGLHAVAHLRSADRLVRGIDRFTHLPTREPAAMVWVADWTGPGHHLELVALDDITICPGGPVVTAPDTIRATTCHRAGFDWDPLADVPDWVVLGLIREHLIAGDPVPETLCPRAEVPAYIPALVAAGHTTSEIAIATGVNAHRIVRRTR